MDDFPVGNPKYSRIKATYSQPPVRQAHPITPEPVKPRFRPVIAAILVIIACFLIGFAGMSLALFR